MSSAIERASRLLRKVSVSIPSYVSLLLEQAFAQALARGKSGRSSSSEVEGPSSDVKRKSLGETTKTGVDPRRQGPAYAIGVTFALFVVGLKPSITRFEPNS